MWRRGPHVAFLGHYVPLWQAAKFSLTRCVRLRICTQFEKDRMRQENVDYTVESRSAYMSLSEAKKSHDMKQHRFSLFLGGLLLSPLPFDHCYSHPPAMSSGGFNAELILGLALVGTLLASCFPSDSMFLGALAVAVIKKDMTPEEYISKDPEIWSKHLKAKTELHQTVIDRCLKLLVQKQLPKSIEAIRMPVFSINPPSDSDETSAGLESDQSDNERSHSKKCKRGSGNIKELSSSSSRRNKSLTADRTAN
ncbi:hypothetical protein EDC04DRAFT_2614008 [Pisolithus marmoratus]|nr:hypothetical protein EDC04DRAFT_2614008 [Pisolithus marmoratus]